ncbi:MAG TPA: hypothetical protein VLG50_00545 [Candidatus Saccharimonadales bacterium]|nr:hypothetical protein [Candidatus Saccharimonadales bacterium]
MKLRIIFFSFISLSMMASQATQREQVHDALTSGDRGALIAAALKLKRPVTPIQPRFKEVTIEETQEWHKAHHWDGQRKKNNFYPYDPDLAKQQVRDMNRSRKEVYDAIMCIYKVKLDIYTIERKKYLEVLERMVDCYNNVNNEAQSKPAAAK